jgi:transcriptional regulator with XRE-family HTH domain
MSPQELDAHLSHLGLTQSEAAQLLGVHPRTVRRWFEGEAVPGPAEHALRAWLRLRQHNLPWRPDGEAIFENNQQQIDLYREDAVGLNEMLSNVKARGKATLPWLVDLERCRATLGGRAEIEIWFYRLPNGGFTLSSYSRGDLPNDLRRDWELIEEAAYCIAKETKKEAAIPVTLVYQNSRIGREGAVVSSPSQMEFSSYEAAIQHACSRIGSPDFQAPFIMERMSGVDRNLQLVWDTHDIQRDCERRQSKSA